MGNHCIDVLEMFLGRTVSVQGATANLVQDYAAEDTSACLLTFESGALGVIDSLFNVPDDAARNMLEIYGSRGSVVSSGTIGQDSSGVLRTILEKEDRAYDAAQIRDEGATEQLIEPEPVNIYQAHIEAFSQAVVDGTDPPVTGEDGVWNHRVVEAVYESARNGRRVELG